MKKINVFIIEPYDTVRKHLKSVISDDEDFTLAGSINAESVEKTVELLQDEVPDVLLLGIDHLKSKEMQLFFRLRKVLPKLPVIVLTQHNYRGGTIALTALKYGAVEYILKTKNFSGAVVDNDHFHRRLIPVIKAVPRMNQKILAANRSVDQYLEEIERISMDVFTPTLHRMDILVIAGCLGGVPALYQLLNSLPYDLPVPVVIVQHMPKLYTELLAEDLKNLTGQNVVEAENNCELLPGRMYIAPGGYHVTVKHEDGKHLIALNRGPEVKGYRPSIDVLLQSVRKLFENRVLTVYLSGGGLDGIEGAEIIDTAGGQVIIQNKKTSLLWDLPWKIGIRGIEAASYPLKHLGYMVTSRLI